MILKPVKRKISRFQKYYLLLKHYLTKISFSKNPHKNTIIFCVDGVFSHGGFVDRLKGIISFHETAKKLNMNFKINFISPFDLSIFFHENKTQWGMLEVSGKFYFSTTKVWYLNEMFQINPIELIGKYPNKLHYVYSNVDFLQKIFPTKSNSEISQTWNNSFKELFSFSSYLESQLPKIKPYSYSVFHTRFTSLLGDFEDTTSTVLNELEQNELMSALVEEMNIICQTRKNETFYVLSDSTRFLSYIKSKTSYQTLEGTPKHIDVKHNSDNLDAHTKTITDFMFISNAKEIFLLKKGKMYNSAFSKYASIIGNRPFHMIN